MYSRHTLNQLLRVSECLCTRSQCVVCALLLGFTYLACVRRSTLIWHTLTHTHREREHSMHSYRNGHYSVLAICLFICCFSSLRCKRVCDATNDIDTKRWRCALSQHFAAISHRVLYVASSTRYYFVFLQRARARRG